MTNYTKKSILKLQPSSTLVINEKSKKLIAEGKKVYSFGFGQSPFPVPKRHRMHPSVSKHRCYYYHIIMPNHKPKNGWLVLGGFGMHSSQLSLTQVS